MDLSNLELFLLLSILVFNISLGLHCAKTTKDRSVFIKVLAVLLLSIAGFPFAISYFLAVVLGLADA